MIDPPADGINTNSATGVTIRGMRVDGAAVPADNGAYGIYLQTEKNVADRGQRGDRRQRRRHLRRPVGQDHRTSQPGVAERGWYRDREFHHREAHENEAVDNTGGILVFDLPNLSREGTRTKVYNNVMRDNNTSNFAPPGSIVGVVPTGTGMLIMAAFTDVEVHNVIENNQSSAIAIVHYDISGRPTDDVNYDGTRGGSTFTTTRSATTLTSPPTWRPSWALFAAAGGLPEIFYDGIGEQAGRFAESDRICVAEDPSVKRGILFGENGASTDPPTSTVHTPRCPRWCRYAGADHRG